MLNIKNSINPYFGLRGSNKKKTNKTKKIKPLFEDFINNGPKNGKYTFGIIKGEGTATFYVEKILKPTLSKTLKMMGIDAVFAEETIAEEPIKNEANNVFKRLSEQGVDQVLRTSFRAKALYQLRQKYNAIKLNIFPIRVSGLDNLNRDYFNPISVVVRDMSQGPKAVTTGSIFNTYRNKIFRLSSRPKWERQNYERILKCIDEYRQSFMRARSYLGIAQSNKFTSQVKQVEKVHLWESIESLFTEAHNKKPIFDEVRSIQSSHIKRTIKNSSFKKEKYYLTGHNDDLAVCERLIEKEYGPSANYGLFASRSIFFPKSKRKEKGVFVYQTAIGSGLDLMSTAQDEAKRTKENKALYKKINPIPAFRMAALAIQDFIKKEAVYNYIPRDLTSFLMETAIFRGFKELLSTNSEVKEQFKDEYSAAEFYCQRYAREEIKLPLNIDGELLANKILECWLELLKMYLKVPATSQ